MKKLTTALLCVLMVFSCAFCVNAEETVEVPKETPVEVQKETQEAETKVAKIGDVEYATLQEAINVAKKGEEVVLINDVKEHVRVSETSNVVLNLNGKNIENNNTKDSILPTITNEGTLTIKGQGIIDNGNEEHTYIIKNAKDAKLEINDAMLKDTAQTGKKSEVIYNDGELTINSGKFISPAHPLKEYFENNGTLTLYGGTYSCNVLFDYLPMEYSISINEDKTFTVIKVENKAYQNENGDLIVSTIRGTVDKILMGYSTVENDRNCFLKIYYDADNYGIVANYNDGKQNTYLVDKFNSHSVIITKEDLLKYSFIDGVCKIEVVIGSDSIVLFDGLKLNLGKASNKENNIQLIGDIKHPVIGESTKINKDDFKLVGENGNNLSDFDVYWAYKTINKDGKTIYVKTNDFTFVEGNEYYLFVDYKYLGINDTSTKAIKLTSTNLAFENVTVAKEKVDSGFELGLKLDGFAQFASEKVVPKAEVAMVGDKTYASLQEAINTAKNGEEVILINDVKEHIEVPETTNVVLNMNGKTIDSDTDIRPTFYIKRNATVDFQGQGYIRNSLSNYGVIVNYGGRCRINGPTVFGTMGNENGEASVIYNNGLLLVESGKITASDTLTPYISGMNEFVVTGGELGNGKLKIVEKNTHTFKLSGGTYYCSEEDLVNFLADGYCLTKDSNGLITIVKANETTIKEPTLVVNKDNLDSVKDTKGLEDIISVGIKLENKKTDELKAEQKKELDTFIKGNVNTDVEHHIICLDLKLVGAKNDGTKVDEITEVLAKPLTVSVALSDADVNNLKGKTIKVIRYHTNADGTVEVTYLDATLNGNELTFKTDRFSTYVVVAYKQVGGATPTPTPTPTAKPTVSNTSKAGPKDLNSDGVITCDEEMGSANWIWSESKKACVYKVSNTSVK